MSITLQEAKDRWHKGNKQHIRPLWKTFVSANKNMSFVCKLHRNTFQSTFHRLSAGCKAPCCKNKLVLCKKDSIQRALKKNPDIQYVKGWSGHNKDCKWICTTSQETFYKSPQKLACFPRQHNLTTRTPYTKEYAEGKLQKLGNIKIVKYNGWRKVCSISVDGTVLNLVPKNINVKILSASKANVKSYPKDRVLCELLQLKK